MDNSYTPLPDDMKKTTKRKIYKVARILNIRRRACMRKAELWRAVHDKEAKLKFFNTPSVNTRLPSPPLPEPQATTKTPNTPKQPSVPPKKPQVVSHPVNISPSPSVQRSPQKKAIATHFQVNDKVVANISTLYLTPHGRVKYKGIQMTQAVTEDVVRSVRRSLGLTLNDYDLISNHMYYNQTKDIFGAEVVVSHKALGTGMAAKAASLMYWVEYHLDKTPDGYRSITLNKVEKYTKMPDGFILIS